MRWLAASAAATGIMLGVMSAAHAGYEVPKADLDRAVAAYERGDFDAAILELEALGDAGVVHPDVSFNRGLAYAARARREGAKAGDLGRAAAAFEEASRLRPSDPHADDALAAVRAEVARRRSRQDKNDTVVRPSLDRAVLQLFSPAAWSIAAIVASALFAIGLLMRWKKSGYVHVTGAVLAPIALLAALALVPAAIFARDLAETRRPGVVVVPEAVLEDERGERVDAPDIPEASLVELGPRKDEKVLVRWGPYEGWLSYREVRVLVL